MNSTLDSQVLRALLDSAVPPRVLDVRTPGEFETVHIPGAYNVPLDLLLEHRDEIIKHLDVDVVLVCRSGQRAVQAEVALRNAGLLNAHILDGGINSWRQRVSRSTGVLNGGIWNVRFGWLRGRSWSPASSAASPRRRSSGWPPASAAVWPQRR